MAEVKALVAGGHVFCHAMRSDRDVVECVGCARLKKVSEQSSPPYIVCDVTGLSIDETEDPLFVQWWHEHHRPRR